MNTVKATCRICNNCGFELDIADNAVVGFRADYNHPLSRGYVCPKGIAGIELQQGRGERVTHSSKKNEQGVRQAIDALQAAREVGEKLAAIIREHGPRSVAMFSARAATGTRSAIS